MRAWTPLILLCFSACAKPTLYESWGQQLVNLPEMNGRVEDVSLLLGTPPSRCEPVAESRVVIGVILDHERPVVQFVFPSGPADHAGIQRGDKIESVAGTATPTPSAVVSQIKANARQDAPLEVRTNRGTYQVFPRVRKAEQCYWEIRAGEVGRASGAAYVNPYGGSAAARSAVYQRYFRASCRIQEGYVVACQANWQQ